MKDTGRKGFGTTVIQRGLSYGLGGKVEVELPASGLICSMQIPLFQMDGREDRNGQ